jgi:hypothetical protein
MYACLACDTGSIPAYSANKRGIGEETEVGSNNGLRACLFLDSFQESGITFSAGHGHGSAGCLCSHSPPPPGSLYDPNMSEEQNE